MTTPESAASPNLPNLSEGAQHRFSINGRELPIAIHELISLDKKKRASPDHVIVLGQIANNPLVRVHSEDFYSNILGGGIPSSSHNDGRYQSTTALNAFLHEGGGILVHRRDDGLGHGLMARAKWEELREKHAAIGEDLDPLPDIRSYHREAHFIRHTLGLTSVRLLTANPNKIKDFVDAGIDVTAIPLISQPKKEEIPRPEPRSLQRLFQVFSRK